MQGSNDLGTKFRDLISVMAILGDSWKLDDEYAYKEVNKVLGCLLGDVIEVLEKGVVRFGKKRKLAPRFVEPFVIIEKVSPMAYWLDLPEELHAVHDTFHVSNLKKCLADPTLKVPLDEI
ncbi:hypothetical protein Tco_0468804 [Tanacetum coccineum]